MNSWIDEYTIQENGSEQVWILELLIKGLFLRPWGFLDIRRI